MCDAIHDFEGLKECLRRRGYQIGEAVPWREIQSEDLDLGLGGTDISTNGIFHIDEYGNKHQVFLYKRKFRLYQYGKPKYHVCKCPVIESFMDGNNFIPEYRKANTESVKVINWDNNNIEEEVSDLALCKYCAKMLNIPSTNSSSNFVAQIRAQAELEAEQALERFEGEDTELDIHGYVKNWSAISSQVRKKHNYTCEKCGTQVQKIHARYIQVHHKNGDKKDNTEGNLQCLCVKCHSEVNETHRKNFSSRQNQIIIRSFLERYPKGGNNEELRGVD